MGPDFSTELLRLRPFHTVLHDPDYSGRPLVDAHLAPGDLEALTSAARQLGLFPSFSPACMEFIRTPWQLLRLNSTGAEVTSWCAELLEVA
eukprot:52861-Pyramimonas_sp.AAC.1